MTRVSPLLLAFVLLGVSACSAQARDCEGTLDVLEERFEVRPGGSVDLELDAGGLEVVRGSGNHVVVRAERCADSRDALARHHFTASRSGNDVSVVSQRDEGRARSWFGRGRDELRVVLKVTVPTEYGIRFSSGAGDVTLADITGPVRGQTGAGNLTLTSVRGSVDVTTGSGNVLFERVLGQVNVQTGAGNVELLDVEGGLRVQTGAGNISAEIARQPKAHTELNTGAGNVTVHLSPNVRVEVQAVASVGGASTDFPLKVEGSWMTKSFAGNINGGGPRLEMRSGVGNVSLKRR